jgi:hypothetical protein
LRPSSTNARRTSTVLEMRCIGVGFACLAVFLGACSQAEDPANPRDRAGSDGPSTWRLVAGGEGQAAFLSKPGAAPDIVLWCRGDGAMTVRVHVFKRDRAVTTLALSGKDGEKSLELGEARIQGAVRDDGAMLAEVSLNLDQPKADRIGQLLANVRLSPGAGEVWEAPKADPDRVLAGFLKACVGAEGQKQKPVEERQP